MQTIQVSSLGFNDLTFLVPATIEEYNALAPKRNNPVLEDACDNIMKHKVLGQFRNKFLDFIEEKFKDVPGSARINSGTEKTPKWEGDMPYWNRLIALVLTHRGLDASKPENVAALVTELKADAQRILNEQKFNVAEREVTGGVPTPAKTYVAWAKEAVEKGTQNRMLDLLNGKLGTNHAFVEGDTDEVKEQNITTLARAIAAYEKKKREDAEKASKAELGLA